VIVVKWRGYVRLIEHRGRPALIDRVALVKWTDPKRDRVRIVGHVENYAVALVERPHLKNDEIWGAEWVPTDWLVEATKEDYDVQHMMDLLGV
jgi:hypothetical protein